MNNQEVGIPTTTSMLNPYAYMLHGQTDLQHQMLPSGLDLTASGYNPQLVVQDKNPIIIIRHIQAFQMSY